MTEHSSTISLDDDATKKFPPRLQKLTPDLIYSMFEISDRESQDDLLRILRNSVADTVGGVATLGLDEERLKTIENVHYRGIIGGYGTLLLYSSFQQLKLTPFLL